MGRIARLDPLVQSQIAAGEVVERPASVVKELVENSLDAGARRITIDFEDGGLSLIRVVDDGSGMSAEDAPLALERFATSKLSSVDDLYTIGTLGFRGEALPSIASVSRLRLETRPASDESGTAVASEGGRVLEVGEKGLPPGTTVTVEDLFFNTPARLKFMKSKGSERGAIVEVVMRLALAWPEVSFTLRSGGNSVLRTGGHGLRNAVADVFGPGEAGSMVEVAGVPGISGFVGLPSLYRRQRDRQIFSVNSRPVKNASLGWALDQAFLGLLPPKSYAVCVLDVALPAEDVDVNVHPAKAEVKFKKDREVRAALTRAVGEALARNGFGMGGYAPSQQRTQLPRARDTSADIHWELVREPVARDSSAGEVRAASTGDEGLPPGWEYMGSIQDTYLVAKTPSSLLVIDKHALMESLTFRSLVSGQSGSQDLLVAEVLKLDPGEAVAYEASADALEAVGFGARLVGDRTVMVTRVPLVLGNPLPPSSLKEVLAGLGEGLAADPARTLLAARMETAACHASVRARERLTGEEARALLKDLYMNPEARTCPHGRPTVREFPLKELGDFFGRTSHDRS